MTRAMVPSSPRPVAHHLLAAVSLVLLSTLIPGGCAHVPPAGDVGKAEAPPVAAPPSPAALFPSDVASVPPHSGTIVYEAVQPDPSRMPRDIVLVLYADRRALLLDRVVGEPGTPVAVTEGTWSLSDAGSVRLSLEEKDGTARELLLKRGEGFLTGDGSRLGGGILLLREI